MRGAAVKKLQQRLQIFGLFKGSVDGVFGPQTEIGVKALQSRYRLNPDGVVGPATWKLLNRQPSRTR
jgi:peptidoglycan hydrolase-like protein with peptidoglycan-binding domain